MEENNFLKIDIFSIEKFEDKIISCINEEKNMLLEVKYQVLLRICENLNHSLKKTQLELDIQDAKQKIELLQKQKKFLKENCNNIQTVQLKKEKKSKD